MAMLIALAACAFSPPQLSAHGRREFIGRALLGAGAMSSGGAAVAVGPARLAAIRQEQADAKEQRLEKLEEKELIYELKQIVKVEELEEKQLKMLRAAEENPFTRATNRESAEKLSVTLKEESSAVEADKQELVFVREEFAEGLVRLKETKERVKADRAALLGFGLR